MSTLGEATATPEPDRADGAPHPRNTVRLFGHVSAVAELGAGIASGRMHHAWLVTGPAGTGKATLCWMAAKRLLAGADGAPGTGPLDTDPAAPAARRIAALSEPGLYLLRRPWDPKRKVLGTQIAVDTVRGLKRFFAMSRPDGGHRVVIVDAADEMNPNAANALLKLLEEPPTRTLFLLVCHRPSRLLPTIRSRCRTMTLAPLGQTDVANALRQADPAIDAETAARLAGLSRGSVGAALRLHVHDGLALERALSRLFTAMPGTDRNAAHAFAASLAARGAEDRRDLALELCDDLIARLARHGIGAAATDQTGAQPLEPALARLSPDAAAGREWAAAQARVGARIGRGLALNLDPHSLILDMVFDLDRTARVCTGGEHVTSP